MTEYLNGKSYEQVAKKYGKTFIVSCTYENTPGIQRQEGFGIQLMTAAGKKTLSSLSDLKSVQATVLL